MSASEQQQVAHEEEVSHTDLCLACKKAPIEYKTGSCGHPVFCKKCAMKCASGGKCKICHELYADLRHI